MKIETKLKKLYLDVSESGSLSGFNNFYRVLKQKGIKISKEKLNNWLASQKTYTIHKPVRKKFLRNQVIAYSKDSLWQMDLVDVSKLAFDNKGIKYLITCIDVFSKFAWCIPIKNKNSDSVIEGFKHILDSGRKPKKLQTDKGKEFLNKHFKQLLDNKNIHLYNYNNSEIKASVIERFNRTLKEKMYRYFTSANTRQYLDILDKIINTYNNSYHRSIRTTPSKVNSKNEPKIFSALYDPKTIEDDMINFKFKIGDTVRLSKIKNIFSKGYTPNWTDELFIVDQLIPRNPPVYSIKDMNSDLVEGTFYEKELQKVINKDQVYEVQKVLKTRKTNGETEYLVNWKGYSSKFNSWIKESDFLK
jgi:hypothetical protein